MFGRNKSAVANPASTVNTSAATGTGSANAATSVIASGTVITGKITTTENLRLDGRIEGDLDCNKRVVMGQSGSMEGKLNTNDTSIKGSFTGDLSVKEVVQLHKTAVVSATLVADRLVVEEGAVFDGDIKIGQRNKQK